MGKQSSDNISTCYLKGLGVKFTNKFSNEVFIEHPHRGNLYGLSKILSLYGVESIGAKLTDKAGILSLDTPFIAQAANDLVLVKNVSKEKGVDYLWKGRNVNVPLDKFNEVWSGVVLAAEANENSVEPDYKKHRSVEAFNKSLKVLALLAVAVLALSYSVFLKSYTSLGWWLLLAANAAGAYIGYLLILKQMRIHSAYADKICSLFKKSDCDNILESSAAKFLGVIGWSEVGFGYFISNLIIIIALPGFINYLAAINILALPYTLWSIWYQGYKAKRWCPLCLATIAVLWACFIVNLIFNHISVPLPTIWDIAVVGSIYVIPYLVIALLIPELTRTGEAGEAIYEFNSLRMKDEVFTQLLKQQPCHDADDSVSRIIFGNPEAPMRISVLTNPYCNPCAGMHKRIEKILATDGDKISVRYILSSFAEKFDDAGKHLLSIYMNNSIQVAVQAFDEWFEKGVANDQEFFKRYGQDITRPDVVEEYSRQLAWREENKLTATPTVMVNGYVIPDGYKIEDLVYFTDLDQLLS